MNTRSRNLLDLEFNDLFQLTSTTKKKRKKNKSRETDLITDNSNNLLNNSNSNNQLNNSNLETTNTLSQIQLQISQIDQELTQEIQQQELIDQFQLSNNQLIDHNNSTDNNNSIRIDNNNPSTMSNIEEILKKIKDLPLDYLAINLKENLDKIEKTIKRWEIRIESYKLDEFIKKDLLIKGIEETPLNYLISEESCETYDILKEKLLQQVRDTDFTIIYSPTKKQPLKCLQAIRKCHSDEPFYKQIKLLSKHLNEEQIAQLSGLKTIELVEETIKRFEENMKQEEQDLVKNRLKKELKDKQSNEVNKIGELSSMESKIQQILDAKLNQKAESLSIEDKINQLLDTRLNQKSQMNQQETPLTADQIKIKELEDKIKELSVNKVHNNQQETPLSLDDKIEKLMQALNQQTQLQVNRINQRQNNEEINYDNCLYHNKYKFRARRCTGNNCKMFRRDIFTDYDNDKKLWIRQSRLPQQIQNNVPYNNYQPNYQQPNQFNQQNTNIDPKQEELQKELEFYKSLAKKMNNQQNTNIDPKQEELQKELEFYKSLAKKLTKEE